jgi:uncharacterized membrane protein YdjX (TVP38/TMEM64 family)
MSKFTRTVALEVAGMTLVLLAAAFLAQHFDLVHVLERMQRRLGAMEWWGALLYPALVAACNLLLLPGSVLTVGSGLFFGLWWGTFLVLCGNVLGAAIAFGIGRLLGRTWVEEKILRKEKWARLDDAISREGWKIVFLSQVHPLFPTSLLNYFYGITRVRFRTCMAWIALAQLPGIFLYAYLGTLAQLGIKLFQRKDHPHLYEYFIWFGGLLLTAIVTTAIGRIALRMLNDAGVLIGKSASAKPSVPSPASSTPLTPPSSPAPPESNPEIAGVR